MIPLSSKHNELFIGIMSGTSLDGVDFACCQFDHGCQLLAQTHLAMPTALRQQLLELQHPSENEIEKSLLAGLSLSDIYAEGVSALLQELSLPPSAIRAIGCHGQTLRHRPSAGYSLQINHPARLAEATGIDVIADFRSRDIAAGGEGAPLVPAFHAETFSHPEIPRTILNLGGMANLTYLPPEKNKVIGFDCGPGNALLDAWCEKYRHTPFDRDGEWARSGKNNLELLEKLRRHPFFGAPTPKSCGREEFNLAWLEASITEALPAADIQATLLELTAVTASQAILEHCPATHEVYVCGGGAKNSALMQGLQRHLPGVAVLRSEALGLPVDAVESAAFAWLARQFCLGLPGNLPAVTGAAGKRRLGALYPGK